VRVDEANLGAKDTQRRVRIDDLIPAGETPDTTRTRLTDLTDQYLVVTTDREAEVAHEALIRHWPRMKEWVSANRPNLLCRQELAAAARAWVDRGHLRKDLAHRGRRLSELAALRTDKKLRLNGAETDYLRACESQQWWGQVVRLCGLAVAGLLLVGLIVVWLVSAHREAKSKGDLAESETKRADDEARNAKEQRLLREEAERTAEQAWRNQYVGLLNLAAQAEIHGQFDYMRMVLDELRPLPGKSYHLTFPWYHYWRSCHRERLLIRDLSGFHIAYSPDGRLLAAGGRGDVRVWEAASGREVSFFSHPGFVNSITFNHDGRLLASGGPDDGFIRVWELSSSKEIRRFPIDNATAIAFRPLGDTLVAAGVDGVTRVWDLDSEEEVTALRPLEDLTSPVDVARTLGLLASSLPQGPFLAAPGLLAGSSEETSSFALSGDGRFVATGGRDGLARVWELDSGDQRIPLLHRGGHIYSVSFSSDAKYLAAFANDGRINVCERDSGREVGEPIELEVAGAGPSIVFSRDNKYLAASGGERAVRVWEVGSGREIVSPLRHESWVDSVAFSPDSHFLASGGDEAVRIWEVATNRKESSLVPDQVSGPVAVSSDNKLVAASRRLDGLVRVWELDSGIDRAFLQASHEVRSVAFSPTSRLLVSGYRDGFVRVWDLESGEQCSSFFHSGGVHSIAFSHDGRQLASGGDDGFVRIWKLDSGEEMAALPHRGWVGSVAFSRDDSLVASGAVDGLVRVWESASHRMIFSLQHGRVIDRVSSVDAVVFSPDGKQLASGGSNGFVRLWELKTGKETAAFSHGRWVGSVAFAPDGQSLAAGGKDWFIRLWELASRKEVLVPLERDDWIDSVAFSPDGKSLVSGGNGVRVWRAVTDHEVHTYCDRHAQAFPDKVDCQLDLVLACWSIYLHHQPEAREDARRALEQGREKLLQLQKQRRLKPDQERWIDAFQTALDGRAVP
jgi:WD40 repeat protein